MGEDETATVARLTTYREIFTQLTSRYEGRVVDTAGDSVLAIFDSVVEAVGCAAEVQRVLHARNSELLAARRMEFRIGVNLGDVIARPDGTIYGDGVNIAARLQALADPGGVCISGTAYDQVKNKVALEFDYLGEKSVKNIAEPVRVYRVRSLAGDVSRTTPAVTPIFSVSRKARLALAAALVVTAGGIAVWTYTSRHSAPPTETTAAGALPLPNKPSIAVLPFVNMSGDPDQEYFSDGMTEDVITSLSKRPGLFVIARNSVFTYKGRAVKPEQISRELGVRYVLEGSVRKADKQVRITAQLIDATTGYHLWAEHYDGDLKDIFALQDGVTQKIVAALSPQLASGEKSASGRPATASVEAYDLLLRGLAVKFNPQKETNPAARRMFEAAIELDPNYANAYAWLGWTYADEWTLLWSDDPDALTRAINAARKAIALDASLAEGHRLLGWALVWNRQQDLGIVELEKAVLLDPNSSNAYGTLAAGLNYSGRPEEAIGFVKKAMRVDPKYGPWVALWLGDSYYLLRRYDEAIAAYQEGVRRNPNYISPHRMLAATYAELGREEEARAEVAEVLRINPAYSIERYRARVPFKNQADLDRYISGLRKAGLK